MSATVTYFLGTTVIHAVIFDDPRGGSTLNIGIGG